MALNKFFAGKSRQVMKNMHRDMASTMQHEAFGASMPKKTGFMSRRRALRKGPRTAAMLS